MFRKIVLFMGLMVLMSGSAIAGLNEWTSIGPQVQLIVNCLAIDPVNTATIYVGTYLGGVFKSTDGGATWTAANTGLTSTSVSALAIDPKNTNIIYAVADDGVFKSADGGTTWSAAGLTNTPVSALAIDPANTAILFAGGNGGGVFKSTDGGDTWFAIGTGMTNSFVQALAIDPADTNIIYAGTYYGGVSKSMDSGPSWTAAGLTYYNVSALAIDPVNTATLYAGTSQPAACDPFAVPYCYGYVFKSTDAGATWSVPLPLLMYNISVLAIDPVNTATLYAGTHTVGGNGGVYRSTDGGATWFQADSGLSGDVVTALAIDPLNTNTVYAGTDGSGVFKIEFRPCTDADGDGYAVEGGICGPVDCNDNNASIHPGAIEICNGVDDNCNGAIDEGVLLTFYQDADGDTFGNPLASIQACSQPDGYVVDGTDCNDSDAKEHPGQTWYEDADNDGYSIGTSVVQCMRPVGYRTASELTSLTIIDNCPVKSNPDQRDIDEDGIGDVCDPCPNDATNTCNANSSGGGSVGSGGGTVSTGDGSVSITLPPGALPTDTSISITETGTSFELSTNLGNGLAIYGMSIQPEGTTFGVPVTIVFSWPDANNDGTVDGTNVKEKNLLITKDNVALTDRCDKDPRCDMVANTFTVQVTSLSEFAVAAVNRPPVAAAGVDQKVSCVSPAGTMVTLDGSASSDPDGDTIASYTWTGPFPEGGGTVTGEKPTVTLPIGKSTITLVVNDGQVNSAPDTVSITIMLSVQGFRQPLAGLVPSGAAVPYPDAAFKAGRTLPLKLSLLCGGSPVSDVAPPVVAGIVRSGNAVDIEVIDLDAGASNDNGLLFRSADSGWVYNLKTSGLGTGSYVITVRMPDGTTYDGGFMLR